MPQNQLRLWSALNLLALLAALYCAGGLVLVSVLLGGNHEDAPTEYLLPQIALGALAGLAVALAAGWFDRRYRPWTVGLVLVGALLATLVTPYWLLPAVLGASAVLRARAGRGLDPVPTPRRQRVTALVLVPLVVVLVALPTVFVVVQVRPTPLYDAMRSDPMASEELPGMEIEYDRSSDRTRPLGIPSPAKIDRSWTITDGTSEPEKIAELARLAQTSGWRRGWDPVFCGWQKSVDGQHLCLVIRSGVGEDAVLVEISENGGF